MPVQYTPHQRPQLQSYYGGGTMLNDYHYNFHKWLLEHKPSGTLNYTQTWWDTYTMFRDYIISMFVVGKEEYLSLGGEAYIEKRNEKINSAIQVIDSYWSKGFVHPIVRVKYKGVEIIWKYNFYNYEVVIVGDVPMRFPKEIYCDRAGRPFYEDAPAKYKLKETYAFGESAFTVVVDDAYKFYTLMVIIKATIDDYKKIDHYIRW